MKILQVGLSYEACAQGAIAKAIHNKAQAMGHESLVCYTDYRGNHDKGTIAFEREYESFIKRGLRRIFGKRMCFARLSTMRLIAIIKQFAPDVVQIHNIHHLTVDYRYLYKYFMKHNMKVVITLHDMWYFTGGCYHFRNIGCTQYLKACDHCPKAYSELDCMPDQTHREYLFKKCVYESIKPAFVSVSHWLYETVQPAYISQYKNVVIENGVDTSIFYPRTSGFFNDISGYKVIAVADYWSEAKGLTALFETACQLDGYSFILIGNCDAVAEKPDNVYFYGRINDKNQLAEAYSDADVFAHFATEETFGMVIAEAACCGLKTVGFDSTGISEVVRNAKGYLAKNGDIHTVAACIKQICEHRQRLTSEELSSVQENFSQERMAAKYLALYQDISGEKENEKQ